MEADKLLLKEEEENKKKTYKKSLLLGVKNLLCQPRRMVFNFILIMFFAFASFLFLGTLAGSVDDTMTKIVNTDYFKNVDKTRILVKRVDDEEITEEDVKVLQNMEYIAQVDMYDNSADVNYHYEAGKDYVANIEYKKIVGRNEKVVEFLSYDNFVKSSYCIGEEDLAYGRLPESYNEVVIYCADDSVLDTEMDIYFSNDDWDREAYGYLNAKVVGILKEQTEQIYFSKELVYGLNTNITNIDIELNITKIKNVEYDSEEREDYVSETDVKVRGDLIINDSLADDEIRVSQNYFYDLYSGDNASLTETYDENAYIASVKSVSLRESENITTELDLKLSMLGSGSSENIMEVNTNTYMKIITAEKHLQCSIYIEDYAYMNRVLDALYDEGYEGMSIFTLSALEYDEELLSERMRTLLITGIALVVVFILSIFVIFAMLRMKTKDLLIMKGLGVKKDVINKSNYVYNLILAFVAMIVVVMGMNVLDVRFTVIKDCTKYMTIVYYIVWMVVCVLVSILSARLFNGSLKKKYN